MPLTSPTLRVVLMIALVALSSTYARAETGGPWHASAFAGALSTDDTSDIFSGSVSFTDTVVVGASVGRTVVTLTDDVELGSEIIVARHTGEQGLWELDGALYLSWRGFLWQRHLRTSFAIGMGPSLSSEVPPLERERHGEDGAAHLTNFVFGELAFGLPSLPRSDLILRYHHRSGFFGLINDVGEASTFFGIGIKRRF